MFWLLDLCICIVCCCMCSVVCCIETRWGKETKILMGNTVDAHCEADVLCAWMCVPAVLVGLVKIHNFFLQPSHLWTLKNFSCKRKPHSEVCVSECGTTAGICCVSTGGLCRHSSAGTCWRMDARGIAASSAPRPHPQQSSGALELLGAAHYTGQQIITECLLRSSRWESTREGDAKLAS